jgi:hypothetical protein
MKVLNALRTSRDSAAEVSKERERGKGFAKDKICVMKDAQIKLRMEDYALNMGLRSNDAVAKDAQIILSKEECA